MKFTINYNTYFASVIKYEKTSLTTIELQYQYVIEHAAWDGWISWILDYSKHICKDGPWYLHCSLSQSLSVWALAEEDL